jgi:hypothetical protein
VTKQTPSNKQTEWGGKKEEEEKEKELQQLRKKT